MGDTLSELYAEHAKDTGPAPSSEPEGDTLDALYANRPTTGFKETEKSKAAKSGAQRAASMVAPAALTALGTMTGPALAGLGLAGRIIPWSTRIAESLGSLGGETLNQATGLSEQSNAAKGIAAISPAAGRLLSSVIQNAPRLLPGAPAAIRAGLVDEGRGVQNIIRHADAGPLYDKLRTMPSQGTQIQNMPALRKSLNELRYNTENIPFDTLRSQVKESRLQALLNQMDEHIAGAGPGTTKVPATMQMGAPPGGIRSPGLPSQVVQTPARPKGMNFTEIQETTSALGKLIRETKDPGLKGAYRKLYGSILTDLEAAPAPPGTTIALWKDARAAYRKTIAKNNLADVIERKAIQTVDGVEQFRAKPVLDWMKNNKDFRKQIGEEEFGHLQRTLTHLDSETSRRSNKLLSILGGAAGASMLGPEHAMTGAAGATAGYIGADIVAHALLNPTARRLLTRWVTNPSGIGGQESQAIMAAALAGAFHN